MDRRLFTRIEIPGATVQFKRGGTNKLFSGMSKPKNIFNISKSGLAFQADKRLDNGEKINMKISFPDGKSLNLKGHIRWNTEVDAQSTYSVGIQFFPFGTSSNYNPLQALDYLRSLDGLSQFNMNSES